MRLETKLGFSTGVLISAMLLSAFTGASAYRGCVADFKQGDGEPVTDDA